MSVPIFVSEGQVVVTLTLLLIVIVGVVVIWVIIIRVVVVGIVVVGVGWLISTVAAAVVVVSATEKILQTKEPSAGVSLVRGLSLPPAAVASSAVAAPQQGAQKPGVGLPIVRLSLPSAAGVVVVVVAAAVQSSTEDRAAQETSAYTKEAAVNEAITGANDSLVCARLCVAISVRRRGR